MNTKQIINVLFGLLWFFPLWAEIIQPEYRYLSAYNGRFTASDAIAPFIGAPAGNSGYYFTKAFGVYYAGNFPWIYLDAYGWCYKTADFESIIYIVGEGGTRKINSPLDQKIQGWYRLEDVYLMVQAEQFNNRPYWAQDLYSLEREETIHVNLGWLRHSLRLD